MALIKNCNGRTNAVQLIIPFSSEFSGLQPDDKEDIGEGREDVFPPLIPLIAAPLPCSSYLNNVSANKYPRCMKYTVHN